MPNTRKMFSLLSRSIFGINNVWKPSTQAFSKRIIKSVVICLENLNSKINFEAKVLVQIAIVDIVDRRFTVYGVRIKILLFLCQISHYIHT